MGTPVHADQQAGAEFVVRCCDAALVVQMKLRLERQDCGLLCTIGELLIDGAHCCWTLEDRVREREGEAVETWKLHGETAIPRGTYNVVVTHSQRFGRELPLLENVPGFEGIRIHPGNTAKDTEGCILVGRNKASAIVTESRAAFNELFVKIQAALSAGDTVTMEIV